MKDNAVQSMFCCLKAIVQAVLATIMLLSRRQPGKLKLDPHTSSLVCYTHVRFDFGITLDDVVTPCQVLMTGVHKCRQ